MGEKKVPKVFTLQGCSKCQVFKKKMMAAGIDFEQVDCTNNSTLVNELGLTVFPSLMSPDGALYDYRGALVWLEHNKPEKVEGN